jgi:nitrous oxidase accessory protein
MPGRWQSAAPPAGMYRLLSNDVALMTKTSRLLTALAALLLLALYALPVWRISLTAPQYPEGIGMYIRLNTIVGATEFDLTKINNLNHYIGMRPIIPASIPELQYMPWIVGLIIAGGLTVAALGSRKGLYIWLGAFGTLAVAGLADFYRWSYDYGHNLDAETAIIKIPGMSYQPPLIGTKQLLNFTAVSWPAAGGWLAGLAFVLAMLAMLLTLRKRRRATVGVASMAFLMSACGPRGPQTLAYDGTEACDYCRMAVTDRRFGAQLVTVTGKTQTFDSIECLASYYTTAKAAGAVKSVWVTDSRRPGTLVLAEQARFVRDRGAHGSPMGLRLIAFASDADAMQLGSSASETIAWAEVVVLVEREKTKLSMHGHDTAGLPAKGIAPGSLPSVVVSPNGPVHTIAEGIRLAAPGGRVTVTTGTYRDSTIVVDKPVEITGEGWPVLDGENARQIMSVSADDVTVRGLVFRNVGTSFIDDRAAIKIVQARGCTVENNRIENAFFGIYLAAVTNCRIAGNVLRSSKGTETASGNGIHVWSSSAITVEDNTVSGHRDGVYFEFVKNSTVRRNLSDGNLRYGLHFMYSDDCRYIGNVFRHNLAGVAVMYTKRVEMVENRFEDNWGSASYGLLLKEISDPRIERNRFSRNTVGLVADGAVRIVAANNQFVDNGWALKLMSSTYDGRFERNDFVGNTFDVASNSQESSNQFTGNYFDNYRGYDLDRDGVGDVPHHPVRLFSVLAEQHTPTLILLRSTFVDLLDMAERVMPSLTPALLADARPSMRRVSQP